MSLNSGHQRAYCSSPRWYMSMESHGGIILTGENRRTRRKTCPSATLSTTNPTWTDTGTNSGLSCERPATNRLSHNTAPTFCYFPFQTRIFSSVLCFHTQLMCALFEGRQNKLQVQMNKKYFIFWFLDRRRQEPCNTMKMSWAVSRLLTELISVVRSETACLCVCCHFHPIRLHEVQNRWPLCSLPLRGKRHRIPPDRG